MSNNTTNISTPVKGMNQDAHPMNLGEQGYDYALNAVVEEFNGNGFPLLQNETSNIPCTKFIEGFKIIGYVNVFEQERIIIFLVNPITKICQIGEIIGKGNIDGELSDSGLSNCADCGDSFIPIANGLEHKNLAPICAYNIIVSSDCLNFSLDHPIKAVYRVENSCGLQVFFTDAYNPQRYIEFDYLNDDSAQPLKLRDKFKVVSGFDAQNCEVPIYTKDVDCNKLLLNPTLDYPCIELVDVIHGGDLKAGVYQFVLAYAEDTGLKRTSYFPATNPIPIFERTQTFETDYKTSKAIQLEISGMNEDSPFLYYNLAVIKTINQQTSFEFVGTFPITQHSVTYTGTEKSLIDLTETDIFETKVFYDRANYTTSSSNYLFFAGMEETDKINVQRIANNVRAMWQVSAVPEPVYRDPKFVNKYRSYMRDEVYPLGLVILFANGEESVVGHIPGPSKSYLLNKYGLNVDSIVSNSDVLDDPSCAGSTRNKLWQVYNTAKIVHTEVNIPITDSCDDNKCYQYGDFAYWESTDKYPNKPEIFGDLCGTPIRHHKFPDSLVTHIHDGLNITTSFDKGNIVFPLGLRIDHDSVLLAIDTAVSEGALTEEQAASIKGYRIVRGNRAGNKSIIAKGLLYDVWNYTKDNQTFYYPNYPYNDLNADKFLTEDKNHYDVHDSSVGVDLPFRRTYRYTFHSPDTHFLQPTLGDELKLETMEYGKSEGYFNLAEEQSKQKLLSTVAHVMALSGGLVAMMMATNETRELSYTVRGTDVSLMGLASGTYGPSVIPPIPIPHTLGAGNGTFIYNNATGIGLPPLPPVSAITNMTKRGTKEQWLGFGAPLMGAAIDGPLGAVVGAFTGVNGMAYKISLALSETQTVINLIKALVPKRNLAIQYNSIGRYNAFSNVGNAGLKRRKIETYSYLKPEMASIEEKVTSLGTGQSTIRFNNWGRESSVYIKVAETFGAFGIPNITDNSRFNINSRGSSDSDFKNFDLKRYEKDISSFYGSIKQYVPDQYGAINNIEYIDTGNCIFFKDKTYTDCQLAIFGGDTFISRFALKRKHQFFLQTRFGHIDETDVKYSDLGNVAYPRYYYDTTTGVGSELGDSDDFLGFISGLFTDPATFLGRPKSYLDAKTNKMFWQNGKIYLYSYGIPYFLVETDINTEMRHGENSKEKDFYPRQQDLNFWLQERNVPPSEDNYYTYNFSYSKQNREHAYGQYPSTYDPNRLCRVSHPNRIVYSNGGNWLSYKANDFYDFSLSNGRLVGVDGIENDKVLVRSENTTQVFNAYVTLQTSADNIAVGTGGMFASKPQEYAHTTLGYAGSQHRAILHTEFGHIWADSKRGQVFVLNSSGLDEISKDGMKNFFKNNLPFQLVKDFPGLAVEDIDNAFKGIGLSMAFDKRFSRFLLTKLDYKALDPLIEYDQNKKYFFIQRDGFKELANLTDKKYFCNKSWTASYNFLTKSWVSYHSYIPNVYIDGVDYFVSGLNGNVSSLWMHNLTNKSYQVFYGKLEPFTIQTVSKAAITKDNLNSVEFALDTIRYHSEYNSVFANDITFNKAVVSNQNQSSGNLELDYHTKNNLHTLINYPVSNVNSTTIRVTNADGIWRFNQFYDLSASRQSNMPLWLNYCSNAGKIVNNQAINYRLPDLDKKRIRGEYCKVLLTNDKESVYKFIFKWMINNSVKTYR